MAQKTPEGLPIVGHDAWFGTLFRWLRWMLAMLTGGGAAAMNPVHLMLNTALGIAYTYANGTSGVGATITANANGAFPTLHGVAPFAGMLVLLNAEGTAGNNGYYALTAIGTAAAPWVLTRVPGFDSAAAIVPGMLFGIHKSDGTYGNAVAEYIGPASPTVGTTALPFALNTKRSRNMGVIPGSRLPFTVQPTANDTVTIGGKTFTFVAALGATAANLQIVIGAAAANTLVNLVNAINGDAASKGTTWAEATAPFAVTIVADAVGTALRVRGASARGGDAKPQAMATTALAASITGGGAWTNDNLNTFGKADTDVLEASGAVTIDAAHITAMGLAAGLIIELGFTPTIVMPQFVDATGKVLSTVTDLVVCTTGGLKVTSAGATHLVATNVISFWCQQ